MISSSGYIDGGDREIKDKMKTCYDTALPKWQSFWMNANIDRRYSLGDQRYLNYYANASYKEQKFIFNVIHGKIQQVLGVQRKGRKSSIVVSQNYGSDETASQLTKVLMWAFARDNTLEKISEGFYNAITTGLNLTHFYLDTKDDPFSGDIKTKNYASSSIIMDPWWTEMDFSDAGFIWSRDYMNLFQLKTMMPDRTKELDSIKYDKRSDIRFTFMPESYQVKYRSKENYAVDSFYYMSDRERTMVHHLGTRQAAELPEDRDVDEFLMQDVPEEERQYIEIVKQTVPSVRLSISVADNVMYDYHYGDFYPFAPMVCYFDPEAIEYAYRFRGMSRIIRDTQYIFNRRMQIQLDTLESLPNSGINVVEDALINEQDAFKTGPGQVRVIKKGYMPDQAISNIMPPQIDQSAFAMTENISGLSGSLLGINEELLGMASDSDVGVTEMLRQGAALTSLRTPFDKLDISQKIISNRILSMIQKHFSAGKVSKILNEQPSEEFFDKAFFEYTCVIEDGLNTSTQKQMQFAQLLQLAALPKIGEMIDPADIFEASTLQDKDKIIENMRAREQQQQQMQQMQAQVQMQQQQVQTDLFSSQSELNRASAQKSLAGVGEAQASAIDKLASAKDKEALIDERRAETLRRLDELDINKIDRLISILNTIQGIETPVDTQL